MHVEIIPYEPIHAYTILERNIREQDTWLSAYPDFDKWVEGWKTAGPSFTLIIDGEIVACAGVILLEWKKGEAWTLLSSLFYKYKKTTFKAIKTYLNKIISDKGLRRLQALVSCEIVNLNECKRMLEHLGFKNETPDGMQSYGPNGEKMLLFGRRC